MKKYQKIFIGIILLSLVFGFTGVKIAKAITIEEIKSQIAVILAKIGEIQKQLDEIKKSESTAAKSIALVSPIGGEKWEVGKSYDIKWNAAGYSSGSNVQIKILDGRFEGDSYKGEMTIANTMNSGVYSWKIPDLLNNNELLGSLYKISASIGEENNKLSDVSNNYFTITKPGFSYSPYFNIIFPQGTEILESGKTYTIKWDYPGSGDYKVNIVLMKNSSIYRNIAISISNTSYYNWTITHDLPGTNYGISISVYDNNWNLTAFKSSSNNIIITQGTISKNIEQQLASISKAIVDLLSKAKELIIK